MTRQELIIDAAYKEAEIERLLKMHPQVFEKTCEWLKENMHNKFEDVQNYFDKFRKAMKRGETRHNII